MDAAQHDHYIQLAASNPDWLCSDAPVEILRECSYAGDEPTGFLKTFFATGYGQWLYLAQGIPVSAVEPEQMKRAALLLWVRACELYTSHVYQRPDPNWERPFFQMKGFTELAVIPQR